MASETDLLHLFIAATPYAIPDVRVFRRNILNVETVRGFRARNGIPGQADAYALVRGGDHVELETKAARGRLAEAQSRWREFCQEYGIPHLVLRAIQHEPPRKTVERWIADLASLLQLRAAVREKQHAERFVESLPLSPKLRDIREAIADASLWGEK